MQPLALHGHMKPVTMVKFNRDGDLIFSTSKEPGVNVWRTSTGERLGTYGVVDKLPNDEYKVRTGHKSVASCDVNGASTLLATAGFDLKTIIWDVQTGEDLVNIEQLAPCRSVGFSHDDRMLFATTDKKMGQKGTIHLYNLPESLGVKPTTTKYNAFTKFEAADEICFAEWGPTNDTIYFGSVDGTVSILDVETMKEIRTSFPHNQEVRKLHFDCNYHTLVTASKDKTACLLDSRDLKVVQTYRNDDPINDASISPTGDHIIIGGGTEAQDVTTTGGTSKFEVRFYHKVHQHFLGSLKCHFGTINSVAFHPTGSKFASGAVDGFVKIVPFDDSYYASPGARPLWMETMEQ